MTIDPMDKAVNYKPKKKHKKPFRIMYDAPKRKELELQAGNITSNNRWLWDYFKKPYCVGRYKKLADAEKALTKMNRRCDLGAGLYFLEDNS